MHIKQARLHGERELRLHHVAIGRESTLFSDRERAALEWTEALTRLSAHGVPDDIYAKARAQFSEDEMIYLTYMVMVIRSEEHTSELPSLMRISYAVFCLKKKKHQGQDTNHKNEKTQTQPELIAVTE